ncbi:MAG: DNA polymerase I [Burkholderiales bacterium 70-64]|nr:MAG: DNA polymerase I [Burkholderiales bacterium 70-64]
MSEKKTLLLVDGSSFLYRAFHALPDLRSKTGEPTGAIYGMVAMLRRLRADGKLGGGATRGAVVFDAPGKTFRDEWYPAYKANRKEMPEDLARQVPVIHELVRALGWPLVMIEGIEADDVIGTLAAQARRQGMGTVVSTGDKDLAQLVADDVVLVNTMVGREGGPVERLDRDGVKAKFGVPPERIVDWLTLVGDAVDNVPGVDKVGPKTAVKWLDQYGSLDAVVEHAGAIGGVVGENLRKALDWLPVARRLVTVKTDCELAPHVGSIDDTLALADEDPAALRALFERCNFRTWLRDLEARAAAAAPAGGAAAGAASGTTSGDAPGAAAAPQAGTGSAAPGEGASAADAGLDYETVLEAGQLERWIARIESAALVALDTETTSLDPMRAELVGLSLSVEPFQACYVPLAHRYTGAPEQLAREQVLERLRAWLESSARAKVGQNLKYDTHVFENHGIRLAGIEHDTLLESYVLEAHRNHDMDSLAERHLNRRTITYHEVAGKGASQIGFEQVPIDRAARYAAEDADVTLHLHRTLYPQIAADARLDRVYREIEIPVSRVLQRMERNGVLIDAEALARQSDQLGRRMLELERQAVEAAGQPFNLNSPKQLGEILFGRLGLPVVRKTASGAPSTDEEVLAKLAEDYPLPRILLDWRALAKLKSTYTDKLPKMVDPRSGRVHTSYSQAVAVTGRLASSDPNLQNIPVRTGEGRRIREAFVAAPGWRIVSADYSQIELRIMAHISGDEGLLRAFEQGMDIHRATAAEIFGIEPAEVSAEQRRYAKVINFGLIYGMSAYGLASNLGIERDAAKNYIERYFARYPGVARYMERTRELARRQGYVETVFGRRLWLAEINSPNGPRRAGAERAAINAPMQGTAADLIKLAMIAVQGWLERERLGAMLIMQVHDELVLEVPEAELEQVCAQVPELMTGVATLAVPLEVQCGVGGNWEQAH